MSKPEDYYKINPLACPVCGHVLNAVTEVYGGNGPNPGDFNVCFYCQSFLTFTEKGLRHMTQPEFRLLSLEEQNMLTRVKQAILDSPNRKHPLNVKDMVAHSEYIAQIETMSQRAMEWRRNNPSREVRVQFNYPRTIMMIAPISEALRDKVVSTNEAGLELVKALWPWNDNKEPTVFMVRMALEHEPEGDGHTSAR